MRALPLLALLACGSDKAGPSLADTPPLYDGPFLYDTVGEDDRLLIDTLWIVTEQAEAEIAADEGQTPEEFLEWRIDDMNATLERSLVESSKVRSLGVHRLIDEDYERSGQGIGDTSVTISYALTWLGTYRETYGADKVMIVAGTEEGASGAALGGGDVSAHWVTFLPVEHEFGHQMGASHCNKGSAGALNYGYPSGGYTDDGEAISFSGVSGGTRMCGNSMAFYSNPDVRLTLEEIDDLIAAELLPDGDWESLVGEEGQVTMGHAEYANMAEHWRSVAPDAAEALPVTRYDGDAGAPSEVDDCIAIYADEGYGALQEAVCAGEMIDGLSDISSIQIGQGVHANLYSADSYGAGSTCGGQLMRLAYSSPSLAALSEHHEVTSLDDAVRSLIVYDPDDRDAHRYSESPYSFYGAGTFPSCGGDAGETLILMPDNRDWTATGAQYNTPVSVPFAVDFTVTSTHSGDDNPPADAMTFFFAKAADSYETTPPTRDQQGVAVDGTGYAVELNVWSNSVALRDSDWSVIGDTLSFDTFTDGQPVAVRVAVTADEVVVTWDGSELLREAVSIDTTHEHVGFSAATGAYTIEYQLEDIVYSAL